MQYVRGIWLWCERTEGSSVRACVRRGWEGEANRHWNEDEDGVSVDGDYVEQRRMVLADKLEVRPQCDWDCEDIYVDDGGRKAHFIEVVPPRVLLA